MPLPEPVRVGELVAGRLRVLREIARGGMGVLYEAEDMTLRRRVALKVMPAELAADAAMRERALREARAVAQIQSPHAVQIFEIGTLDGGVPYLVLELLEGETLEAVLEREGPLPVETALRWTHAALGALAEAHARGLVHRDVKPANLFLARSSNGESVKVLDFGLVLDQGAIARLTQTGEGLGTPAYMAPEQMRASREVDARVDVWAVGVTLYELLTRRMPFEATSIPGLMRKVLSEPPTPIVTYRTGVPASVAALVERCLAREPTARFPDARALREAVLAALRELSPDHASSARLPATPTTASRAPAPAAPARAGLFVAMVGGTMLLGGAGLALVGAQRAVPLPTDRVEAGPVAETGRAAEARPDAAEARPDAAVAPSLERDAGAAPVVALRPQTARSQATPVSEQLNCSCLWRGPNADVDSLCARELVLGDFDCGQYQSWKGVSGSKCRGISFYTKGEREGRLECPGRRQ